MIDRDRSFDFLGVPVRPRATRPIAITGVAVVPMDREVTLPAHTVVLDGPVIRTVAPSASVSTSGMEVVDGTGRFLLPGLADMHAHPPELSTALAYLANGVTFVRNMSGTSFHLAWRRAVSQARLPGPHLTTTGPIVDGAGPAGGTFHAGLTPLTEPAAAAALIQQHAERGYGQIKAYSLLRPEVLVSMGAAARSQGIPLGGHCPMGMTYEQALDAGMTFFEHLQEITAGHGDETSPDLARIRELAKRLHDEQIWNCPTMIVTLSYFRDPDPGLDAQWTRYASADNRVIADLALGALRATDSWPAIQAGFDVMNQGRREILRVLAEEDAPLLIGTDSPVPYVTPGFSTHQELAAFIDSGLSPYRALRAATAEAARFLGEDSDWGTVSPGKRADLVLVDGDPLYDVEVVRTPRTVFVNGFVFDRDDLDRMLKRRAELLGDQEPAPGGLRHTIGMCCAGALRTRRTPLADGSVRIEETDEGAERRRRADLLVSPAGEVRKFTVSIANQLGEESCLVEERPEGGYRWEVTDLDGLRVEGEIAQPGLVPDPSLALTAAAELREGGPGPRVSLALQPDFLFPGLVLGRPVARTLSIREDDRDSARWIVDDGLPAPSAPWAGPLRQPFSLTMDSENRVVAIGGTDFVGLGGYTAQAGSAAGRPPPAARRPSGTR
jgi:imidazolonepropionase-like amidohydrolase